MPDAEEAITTIVFLQCALTLLLVIAIGFIVTAPWPDFARFIRNKTRGSSWWHTIRDHPWLSLATAAYVLGWAVPYVSSTMLLDQEASEELLRSTLTAYIIVGLVFAGIGQFMQASTHNRTANWTQRIDGVGKSVSVFGWSFGIFGTVIFTAEGTNIPLRIMETSVSVILIVPCVPLFFLMAQGTISDLRRQKASHRG